MKIEKLFYQIDKFLVKYPNSKIWIFLFLSITFILIGAGLLSYKENISIALWDSWTYFADPGTHVEVNGTYLRSVSVFITILGMVFFALLIGLISEAVENKVEALKEGKTKVYEENHIVIIGFSLQTITIIKQLQYTNQKIVLLSNYSKQEIEDILLSYNIKDVICRNGEIDNIFYLDKVNIKKAKSVIIVANDDGLNMKLILLLTKKLHLKIPITIEIQDEKYQKSLNLLEKDYPNLNFIYTKQSLARLLALSAIYIGVGQTYDKLFDYNGDSFYLIDDKCFFNKNILEIAKMINKRLIGIYSDFSHCLIIDTNYKYQQNDKILILSDNNKFKIVENKYISKQIKFKELKNEEIYLIGENEKKEFILDEFKNRNVKLDKNSDTLVVIGKDDNEVISNLILLKQNYANIFAEVYSTDLVSILSHNDINDYIISTELVAKLLVSVSFSNEMNLIINDLLSKGGNIMYIIQIQKEMDYVELYFSLLSQNIALIGVIEENIINLHPKKLLKNQKLIVISNKG